MTESRSPIKIILCSFFEYVAITEPKVFFTKTHSPSITLKDKVTSFEVEEMKFSDFEGTKLKDL